MAGVFKEDRGLMKSISFERERFCFIVASIKAFAMVESRYENSVWDCSKPKFSFL